MWRILFEIPGTGLRVPGFGACLFLACAAALALTVWRARRERIDPESVMGLAAWLMTGGFLGARALFVVTHPESVQSLGDVFRLWQGGIVYYGCLFGGLIGSILYWARNPFPFRAMADCVAPALALGSAIGRLGCFLNGCCYGAPSNGPLAVRFPAGTLPWAHHVAAGWIPETVALSLPVYPTQLFAVVDGLVLLAILTLYFPWRRRDGEVIALLMVIYPVFRFVVESYRNDDPRSVLGLTSAQAISVALLAAGVFAWSMLLQQPRSRHVDEARLLDAKRAMVPPGFQVHEAHARTGSDRPEGAETDTPARSARPPR